MKEGDVLLAALRQADGQVKDRPVLFLKRMPPFQDLLVCGVSTQIPHQVEGFDELIRPDDADFRTSPDYYKRVGWVEQTQASVGLRPLRRFGNPNNVMIAYLPVCEDPPTSCAASSHPT
jgi:hypothetical protein